MNNTSPALNNISVGVAQDLIYIKFTLLRSLRLTVKKIYSLIVYLSRPKELIPRREILRNLNKIFT
jgi:hypothetical protein